MLEWLGEKQAAVDLMKAVELVTEQGIKTKDLGGKAMTEQVTLAVIDEINRL
jgi:isocitrate/isopropylmalate dehydrogenase